MPRYHFNLHECGSVVLDEEGRDCLNDDAAYAWAIVEARTMMAAEILKGKLCLGCHIEVVDERGEAVAIVHFRHAIQIRGIDSA